MYKSMLSIILAAVALLGCATTVSGGDDAEPRVMTTIERNHIEIIYPTVRVSDKSGSHGSGTIIFDSEEKTIVITNHHVIKNSIRMVSIEDDGEDGVDEERGLLPFPERFFGFGHDETPEVDDDVKVELRDKVTIEVFFYENHMSKISGIKKYESEIMVYDELHDLAILEFQSEERHHVAKLPRRSQIESITMFQEVYVSGCPLAEETTISSGEISNMSTQILGMLYWKVNAPIIFGNSGGGVFLKGSNIFIGIPTRMKGYSDGWTRHYANHMAAIAPIERIYGWLASTDYSDLIPSDMIAIRE